MFRKLLALEVAALTSNEENSPYDRSGSDKPGRTTEVFAPRTGNYGSMWSTRSFG